MKLDIPLEKIDDIIIRDAIESIKNALEDEKMLSGEWQHYEITESSAVSNRKYKHNFNFVPKDVITTFVDGGAVTWHYDEFDSEFIVYSTASTSKFRFFVGNFRENT